MKKYFRIAGVLFLVAIWFTATGAATASIGYSDFRNDPGSSHARVLPDFSAQLFYNTAQAESEICSFNNLPGPDFKDPHGGQGSVNKAIDQIFEVGFAQYVRQSLNFLVQHRKSDIIFPFHYFW